MPDMSSTAWIEACEKLDWRVRVSEDEIELEKYSPAGEDFIFSITDLSNIPGAVREYADGFDTDEHIEMWILARRSGVSGIPTAAELVEDARDIKNMLLELADALSDLD